MPPERRHAAARLTDHGHLLLDGLREKLGLNTTAVIELAIRRLAELEGITATPPADPKPRRE